MVKDDVTSVKTDAKRRNKIMRALPADDSALPVGQERGYNVIC